MNFEELMLAGELGVPVREEHGQWRTLTRREIVQTMNGYILHQDVNGYATDDIVKNGVKQLEALEEFNRRTA